MSDPIDGGGYTGGDSDLTGQQGTGGGSTGINPSWQEYLNEVPQEFHEKIIPAFQKWDQGVQKRFDQVHQTYEPWKPIVDAGIDPETAQFALQLLNSVNEDPKTVWEAIGNYHNFLGSGAGQGQLEPETEEDPYAGRFSELERQNQIMAAHLLKTRERELEAQAEAQLDQELNQMREKYKSQGAFDERYVLALMSSGMETEQAVQEFYSHRDNLLKQYGQKPLIMGTGGGVPQFNNTDVRKLSNGDTKNLITQMLQQAHRENNQ